MKRILLPLLPAVLLGGCVAQDHEENMVRLRRFYQYYITEVGTNGRGGVSRDTLEKYCTRRFLEHSYADTTLDFDPLTSDDRCKAEWAKTVMVMQAHEGTQKEYRISYLTDKQYNSHNFMVILGKENKEWKIDLVKE